MWSTIFTAASTVVGSRALSGGSEGSGISVAEAKAAYDFDKRPFAKPKEATPAGQVSAAVTYNQLLSAWDDYLNNDYLEMSKRIIQ